MAAIDNLVSRKFLLGSRLVRIFLPALTSLSMLFFCYMAFVVVPDERVMGAVQRLFYVHVGAAMACYIMLGLLLLGSVCVLAKKPAAWDALAQSSAAVALLMATIVLVSGMIWAHSAWNTWWRWEPRLVSFLVMWLLLLGYVFFRRLSGAGEREQQWSAILGILTTAQIPLVILSIQFLSGTEQLHPRVIENQGLRDVRFVWGMLSSNLAFVSLAFWLLCLKLGGAALKREVENLGYWLKR